MDEDLSLALGSANVLKLSGDERSAGGAHAYI